MWTAPKKKQKIKGSTEGLSEHEINLRSKNVKRIVDSCFSEEDLNITSESTNHSGVLGYTAWNAGKAVKAWDTVLENKDLKKFR